MYMCWCFMCVILHSSLKASNVENQALQNDKNRTAINNKLIILGANSDEVYFSRGRK